MPVLLSEQDVRIVLTMGELIAAMEAALIAFSAGHVEQPVRTVLEVGLQRAFFAVMPAFIPESPALGTKIVTVFPSNTSAGVVERSRGLKHFAMWCSASRSRCSWCHWRCLATMPR